MASVSEQGETLSAEGWNARAIERIGAGDLVGALDAIREAVELEPANPRWRANAALLLRWVRFGGIDPYWSRFIAENLRSPHTDHDAMAPAALSLLRLDPVFVDVLVRGGRPSAHALDALTAHPSFLSLLREALITDLEVERLVGRIRRTLLAEADGQPRLELACAVALQAHRTEYVHWLEGDEGRAADALRARVGAEVPRPDAPGWVARLAIAAAYGDLADLDNADALDAVDPDAWPEAARDVLDRSLRFPREERALRPHIPAMTPIRGGVSSQVREEYEEHPYPRPRCIGYIEPRPLRRELERLAPAVDPTPGWGDPPRLLIGGCGSGPHSTSVALRHPQTEIIAVDMSLASLASSIRETRRLGISNISFSQADLALIPAEGEPFDVVESMGVLHHMEDPMEGWRALTARLKPGGLMRIGLYSELGRKVVVQAREAAAQLGVPGEMAALREFRRKIVEDPAYAHLERLSAWSDFFSLGEFRDLVAHVQEHRFTIPQLGRCLDELNLVFKGFLLDDAEMLLKFRARNPEPEALTDLRRWHAFEVANPEVFRAMYFFVCQKRV
jgi:SAM-dependent methyltransferase